MTFDARFCYAHICIVQVLRFDKRDLHIIRKRAFLCFCNLLQGTKESLFDSIAIIYMAKI
jgi:hypothetical protein